jgi:hypothetical protein
MKLMCLLLRRKQSANTSPKAVVREVSRSRSQKMTQEEVNKLVLAAAAAIWQLNEQEKSK